MSILVIAEHDGQSLNAATLSAIAAAQKLGGEISVLVAGKNVDGVAAAASRAAGVAKVLKADDAALEHGLAESLAPFAAKLAEGKSHVVMAATMWGKNVAPRIAALIDSQQISDITAVIDAETFERPIYAGNAIATVKSKDARKLVTIRPTAFDAVAAEGGNAPVENVSGAEAAKGVEFVSRSLTKSDRPELATAPIVVSGGRALGSAENFKLIDQLADKLGAAVGASRAAVDAGYVPNDLQVGQTGKVVAPNLYIAIGISGAIQHLAGMKESKVIVAINKDGEAPIFQIADYGLVGDLFQIVPELIEKL
jgi:electron transfer flavoprotein alpha subunit